MRERVGADARLRVAGARSAVEQRQLLAGQPAQQQLAELGQEEDPFGQRFAAAAAGQVERVERDRVLAGERQVGAADRLSQAPVLALGVEHERLHAAEQQAQRLQLGEVALAGARAGEQDAVVVLARKAIEQDRRATRCQPVQDPGLLGGRVDGGERKGGRQRLGVEGAAQAEPVEPERQGGEPAIERAEAGGHRVQEQRGAEGADAFGPFLQLLFVVCAHRQVEAAAKEAALATRQPRGELVGILGGGGHGRIGELAAIALEPARRLEPGALASQPVGRERRRQRLDVQR